MTDKTAPEQTETDAQEPSMEDILSSIRRILSEEADGTTATTTNEPSDPAPDAAAEKPDDGVVGADAGAVDPIPSQPLAEAERAAPLEPPAAAVDPEVEAVAEPPRDTPEVAPPPRRIGEPERPIDLTPAMRVDRVVSQPTAGASADVLAQLAKAILDRRDVVVGGRDVTLEGMVREMLRPLLKEWLDRNLPYLIERLVRKEIDSMINRAERLEE